MDGDRRPLTVSVPPVPPYRWTRDNRILLAIGLALGAALAGGYALVLRTRDLSAVAATNRVLLFVLFYIVVVLILVLLFVLVRSGVKLVLEARRGVFGSRFRVRVVVAYVGLALLPISHLILPTTGLHQKSVERWFAPPVEDTIRFSSMAIPFSRATSEPVAMTIALASNALLGPRGGFTSTLAGATI